MAMITFCEAKLVSKWISDFPHVNKKDDMWGKYNQIKAVEEIAFMHLKLSDKHMIHNPKVT
jgi:hypothetical protein